MIEFFKKQLNKLKQTGKNQNDSKKEDLRNEAEPITFELFYNTYTHLVSQNPDARIQTFCGIQENCIVFGANMYSGEKIINITPATYERLVKEESNPKLFKELIKTIKEPTKRDYLNLKLFQSLEIENYEIAAIIRDELKEANQTLKINQ